jgi:hypothetical protein
LSKLNKILSMYGENREISLLSELSYEISNFKTNFKGAVKSTYILSPAGSSLFGLEIYNEELYIGVPSMLWDDFMNLRWYLVNYIKGVPGIFMVFDMGVKPKNKPVAIRIHLRTERVLILDKFRKINIIKIDNKGVADFKNKHSTFKLPLKSVKGLDWE